MNALIHDSQILFKPVPRRTESLLDGRPRLSQDSTRKIRIFSISSKRVHTNPAKIQSNELTSTKISEATLNPRKDFFAGIKTIIGSRPFTAVKLNKQRHHQVKSNEKHNTQKNVPEEQKQNIFGPTIQKIFTPINCKGLMVTTKIESLREKHNGLITDYVIGKDIGKGAYAVVKYAIHKSTNRKVAIKIYDKSKFMDQNKLKNVQREIQILHKLNHPNILKLYESIETETYIYLILELIKGFSLSDYVKRRPDRRLEESEACRIFYQLVHALGYCHSNNITHRDIKFENILIDHTHNVKLIDFGFSTNFSSDQKTRIFCGTPSYMAPEIISRVDYYGSPVDIWAIGVVLYGMICGYFPFKSHSDKDCYKKIQSGVVYIPNFVSECPKNIIEKTLLMDPNKRLTAKQILLDP